MTILDLKPQLQITSNPVFERDNTTYGDDEHKYEHLLKDIPYNKNGVPCIKIYGFYQEIIISVGSFAWERDFNPVEALQEHTDYIRSTKALQEQTDHGVQSIQDRELKVVAEFRTTHWPLALGFQRLGEFLAFLGDEEIGYERWHNLTISLPDIELPYITPSLPMLPLDAFANLRHLTWSGHRKQLLVSWLPLVPSVLRTLTTLEIQCDIALQDCCHLLYYGSNLKNVTLKLIQKDLAHEQVLCFIAPTVSESRPLEYLCLVSNDDIGPLLRPFSFPSLRRISFTLAYPTRSTFADLKIWKTLQRIHMRGNISNQDCDWIRSQCSPTTQYDFDLFVGLVRGAASFLHNDWRRPPFFRF